VRTGCEISAAFAFWGIASLALAVHACKQVWNAESGIARLTTVAAHA